MEDVRTHSPDWGGEAKHSSLHSIGDEGNDVVSQPSVSVQGPENVDSMDLQQQSHTPNSHTHTHFSPELRLFMNHLHPP